MKLRRLISELLIDELISELNNCIKNIHLVIEFENQKKYTFDQTLILYNQKLIEIIELELDLKALSNFIKKFLEEISLIIVDEKENIAHFDKKSQENKKRLFEFIIYIQNNLAQVQKIIIAFNWAIKKMGNDFELSKDNAEEFNQLINHYTNRKFKSIRETIIVNSNIISFIQESVSTFENDSLIVKKKTLEELISGINFEYILDLEDINNIIIASKISTSLNMLITFIDLNLSLSKTY
ncbi:hypothetical protein CK556_01940 [Mesoplasma chauliocola]|uniref:Uncharacterized protein n=1 Tax=Mesoplasma chauliocola TaxID=216427 RepID=A0A249SNA1_9MOLU|nr:hypothetical protein [Mesoplasma chauliocola]ASZ09116.1 hypothetical protein CK556_01940 [Mesoplasma chauliocola]